MCPKAKNGPGDAALLNHEWCSSKAQINGSLMHITAIFGMTIAGLVRDGVGHLVQGNTRIKAGDHVVIFCLSGAIHKIEKLFN